MYLFLSQKIYIIAIIFIQYIFVLTSKIMYLCSSKNVNVNVSHMYFFPRNCRNEAVNIFYYVAILGLITEKTLVDNDRCKI